MSPINKLSRTSRNSAEQEKARSFPDLFPVRHFFISQLVGVIAVHVVIARMVEHLVLSATVLVQSVVKRRSRDSLGPYSLVVPGRLNRPSGSEARSCDERQSGNRD